MIKYSQIIRVLKLDGDTEKTTLNRLLNFAFWNSVKLLF